MSRVSNRRGKIYLRRGYRDRIIIYLLPAFPLFYISLSFFFFPLYLLSLFRSLNSKVCGNPHCKQFSMHVWITFNNMETWGWCTENLRVYCKKTRETDLCKIRQSSERRKSAKKFVEIRTANNFPFIYSHGCAYKGTFQEQYLRCLTDVVKWRTMYMLVTFASIIIDYYLFRVTETMDAFGTIAR